MSSKKITDADKLEITRLYRYAEDTTASLASRYGVSNSTISRLLKTSIPEAEYDILIQQKRVSKVSEEEQGSIEIEQVKIDVAAIPMAEICADQSNVVMSTSDDDFALITILPPAQATSEIEDGESSTSRRSRRRSSAPLAIEQVVVAQVSVEPLVAADSVVIDPSVPMAEAIATPTDLPNLFVEANPTDQLVDLAMIDLPPKKILPSVSRTPVLKEILADSNDRYSAPPAVSEEELDDEDSDEDVSMLAAMFGEEVADSDDDDGDTEDWDEESTSDYAQINHNQLLTADRLNVQVTPLSQATLPRTCYIVIDKFAELIVRPLKDFADLGQISGEEIQQRTLPIFDNHRVAKRFSNQRTQRVIKVPDSRVFYKTTQQLRLKGITRLLVDGNIYSLN
jgi:transposase-like protein